MVKYKKLLLEKMKDYKDLQAVYKKKEELQERTMELQLT